MAWPCPNSSIIFSLSPCLRISRVVASTGNPVMRKALFRNIPSGAASRRGRHSDKIFRELLHPLGSDRKPLRKTGFSLDNFSSDDTRSLVSNKEGLCESTARKGSNGLTRGEKDWRSPNIAPCIFQIHNFLTPIFRKDIELFPSGLPRCGSSPQKPKDFASLWQTCSHRALFPLALLRQAALRSIPQRAITAVRSESSSLKGPATPRETVPALFSLTASEFALRSCDHLRRPHCAPGGSAPVLPRGKPAAPLRVRRSSRR